jgi:DNA-binding transcriptional MerR regulator
MKTSEVIKHIGIPLQKLYYLEQKGYIVPKRTSLGDIDSLEFSSQDVEIIRLIWKFLKQGYKHKIAHLKALEELS